MRRETVPAMLVTQRILAVAQLAAQQTQAPQRTIVSRPEGSAAMDQKSETGPAAASARAIPQNVGEDDADSTEGYYRLRRLHAGPIRAHAEAAGVEVSSQSSPAGSRKPPQARLANRRNDVDAGAFDTLGQSMRDLNAIRDANLSRVQKDGCPPEIASRIAST